MALLCGSCLAHATGDAYCPYDLAGGPAYLESYKYVSIGINPLTLLPGIGVGYRQRMETFGWDSGMQYSTTGKAHDISINLMAHYYLNPEQQNSVYLGLGGRGTFHMTNSKERGKSYFAIDSVIGKVLSSDNGQTHFIELHVVAPSWAMHKISREDKYVYENNKVVAIGRKDGTAKFFATYGVAF